MQLQEQEEGSIVDEAAGDKTINPEGDDENTIWYKNVIQRIRHYMLSLIGSKLIDQC